MIVFQEDTSYGYANRTMKNASADITFAFAVDFTTAGEILTKKCVKEQKKIYVPIDIKNTEITKERVDKIVDFINKYSLKKDNPITINIAGNGIYTLHKFGYNQKYIDEFIYEFLCAIINHPNFFAVQQIRSGGQTGVDESGLKSAVQLNIPALCFAPKGWKFRNKFGQDIQDEKKFKQRFNNE